MSTKIGKRFIHSQLLEDDYKSPLTCIVTQTNREVVYYRPIYKDGTIGGAMYETIEKFPNRVKEWLDK